MEWVAEVPEHWNTGRLRWLSTRYAGGTPDKANLEYWADGTIPWINSGAVNQAFITEPSEYISEQGFESSSARWIPKGALVTALAGQGKTKGMVAQLGIRTTCNQSMAAIVPSLKFDSRFLYWWLSSNYQRIRNMAGGDLRDGLNLELLGDIQCPLPSVAEQQAIATLLDSETARMDALIAEQQRLIELLKEKRQAFISHAVTKGLNQAAPMKSSGVEWFGEVPAHWEVRRLRHVSPEITVGIVVEPSKYYVEEGVPALRSLNIRPGSITLDGLVFISSESNAQLSKSKLRSGDLVAVRSGQPGTTAVVPQELDGCNCIDLIIIRKPSAGSERFLSWFLGSDAATVQFSIGTAGAIQQHFNVGTAMDLLVTVPPSDEQHAVAAFLDQEGAKFDALIAEAERSTALLQERHTALVFAAVTGEIDVFGAAGAEAA